MAPVSLSAKNKVKKHRLQVLCWKPVLSSVMTLLFLAATVNSEEQAAWQLGELSISNEATGVQLLIDSFTWQDDLLIENISYQCPKTISLYPIHQCHDAKLSFDYGDTIYLTKLNSTFDFRQSFWQLLVSSIDEQLTVSLSSENRTGQIKLKQLKLTSLIDLLKLNTPISDLPVGDFDGQLLFDFDELTLKTIDDITFNGLSYEYSNDVIVAELAGQFKFELDLDQQLINYHLQLNTGEMLFNEVYVDFSGYPITIDGQLSWQSAGYLIAAELTNKQSLALSLDASLNNSFEWSNPNLRALVIDSHHFNQHILGSVLGIYGFGESGMSGQFEVIATSDSEPFDQWNLTFNDYYFLNEPRKIAAEALNGRVDWHQSQANDDSSLSWQGLLLAGLPVNAANITFNFSQDHFELIGTHDFPVFNGAIQLGQLKLDELFSESIEMNLYANILPISLKLITEKMGWPIMAGSISGEIPGMVKQGQVIKFLGALDLDVFAGNMLIDNLSLERLFGVAPVIAADVKFDGFDLSLLTETFGFGLITGKLSGIIDDLRITNWKTDRLDAEVFTVKAKGVKQTISQRAIDNISSLGGIQGAISKTFLRFFDDFRYKKIKLSCKLHNSVCEIGGIKNQNNQFTIVEGGGIPNINIVGFVRTINWDEFISRLLNANYDG